MNKILNAMCFIIVVSLFSGCAIGFKNELTWEKSKNYETIIGHWNSKKNVVIIKEEKNNLIFTLLSFKKNSEPDICIGKFLEDKNTKIIQLDISSCSNQENAKNLKYKYLFLKVKHISMNEMYLNFLSTNELGKIVVNNHYINIDENIVKMCKEEIERSAPILENGENLNTQSFKYSSFEHCLAVNLDEKNLSMLLKNHHDEIFISKNNVFYFKK